jgi:hypothetical protein
MSAKGITLKTAKKKPGTLSRARVRSIVAEVYATPLAQLVSSTPKKFGTIVVTKTGNKS